VAEMARRTAVEMFGPNAYTDGYRVYTTLDSQLQSDARDAVIFGLQDYDKRHGYRGPEQKLPVPTEIAEAASSGEMPEADALTEWHATHLEALAEFPTYAEMRPAAVVGVAPTEIDLLLSSGEQVKLKWEGDLTEWRPYLSIDNLGPKPSNPADMFEIGDVVRLRRNDGKTWALTQIPQVQAALVALSPR